jgi:hypothetical protein
MATENLMKPGRRDDSRVDLDEEQDLRYWSERLGVSRAELRRAVCQVGPVVKDIKQHLVGGFTGAGPTSLPGSDMKAPLAAVLSLAISAALVTACDRPGGDRSASRDDATVSKGDAKRSQSSATGGSAEKQERPAGKY